MVKFRAIATPTLTTGSCQPGLRLRRRFQPIGASVRVRVVVRIPENNAVSYAPKQPSAIRRTCRGKVHSGIPM